MSNEIFLNHLPPATKVKSEGVRSLNCFKSTTRSLARRYIFSTLSWLWNTVFTFYLIFIRKGYFYYIKIVNVKDRRRVLASARQNLCFEYWKFWRALASTRSGGCELIRYFIFSSGEGGGVRCFTAPPPLYPHMTHSCTVIYISITLS